MFIIWRTKLEKQKITISANVFKPIEKVWDYYNNPDHTIHWNSASDFWHTPYAQNDLKVGGKFLYRMEAKDGSMGFDFFGTYDEVEEHKLIAYTLGDGRKARISFNNKEDVVEIVIVFEAEPTHTIEQQRDGWQAILNNFKKYTETH